MTIEGRAEALVAAIRAAVEVAADPVRAANERRYLKSELRFVGASVPTVRAAVRRPLKGVPGLDRATLLALAETLWAEPVHEYRLAAAEALVFRRQLLEAADLVRVERFVRESRTWALVDVLAPNVAGSLVERFPELGDSLDRWAADPDFWVRRAALLALMPGLARAAGDWPRFAAYADAMLDEYEFFIRKAIGWVLRETAKRRPALVDGWLAPRTGRVSGVTLREAVRWLPAEARDRLQAAYRARRPAEPPPKETAPR